MNRRTKHFALATAALVALAGCSSSSGGPSNPSATSSTSASATPLSGSITVFAASSLKEVFDKLAMSFESANPGTKITFSFGASSTLATQIVAGAPADVFAAASTKTMDTVVSAGDASAPANFAKNTMEIATPPSNPAAITSLNDLARSGVKVALCQPQVPCGTTADKVLTNAKLTVTPATLEPDVKSVLTKVELGEADAGIVYVTDVLAAGAKVHGVTIPASVNATTTYPIAALTHGTNADLAAAFVAYVLSADGQAALTAAGFAAPQGVT